MKALFLLLSCVAVLGQRPTETIQVVSGGSSSNAWVGGRMYGALPFASNPVGLLLLTNLHQMTLPLNIFQNSGDAIEVHLIGTFANIQNEKRVVVTYGSENIFDTGEQKVVGSWRIIGYLNMITPTKQYYFFQVAWPPSSVQTTSGICNQTNNVNTLLKVSASSVTANGVTNEAFFVNYISGPHGPPTPASLRK